MNALETKAATAMSARGKVVLGGISSGEIDESIDLKNDDLKVSECLIMLVLTMKSSPVFKTTLVSLDLSFCKIRSGGAFALAALFEEGLRPRHRAALQSLDLSHNDLILKSTSKLDNFDSFSKDKFFSVTPVPEVDMTGAAKFFQSIEFSNLTDLNISYNQVGTFYEIPGRAWKANMLAIEALAKLIQSKKCPLRKLNYGWNNLRAPGLYLFSEALAHNSSLTSLSFVGNKLAWGNSDGRFCKRNDYEGLASLDEGLAPHLTSIRDQYACRVKRWKEASRNARKMLKHKQEPFMRKLRHMKKVLEELKFKNEESKGEYFVEIGEVMVERSETQDDMRVGNE